jgi:hypothetical protein
MQQTHLTKRGITWGVIWQQRIGHFSALRVLAVLALAGSCAGAFAQYGPPPQYGPQYMPAPQSSYWQQYHEDRVPNYAARWGFHAGEVNGQRDRDTGHSYRPAHDDAYKHVPSSNGIPIPRDEFKNIYRDAYIKGYSAGYGR